MKTNFDILFVDDNKELAQNLNDILTENGYGVSIVFDGKSAVECCRDKEFDLALVDMKLPDTYGLKLIDELSKLKSSMEFIIITGFGTMESATKAVELKKIVSYITKPIDIQHLLILIKQLTKRRKTEEALKESEAKHRNLIKNIPGMVYKAYPDWSAEIISGCKEICGYTSVEIHNKANNWIDVIHPADREEIKKDGLQLVHKQKELIQIYRIITKSDDIHWVEDHKTSIFSEKGEFTGIEGIVFDITERKRAEVELSKQIRLTEQILKTTMDGYILADTDGKLIEVNPAYCQMAGYSREELLKMNIRELEAQYSPEDTEQRIKQMVSEKSARFETKHKRKDGNVIDLDVSIVIMQQEETPLVAAFVRDITDSKKAEEELKKSREQLRVLSQHLQSTSEEERFKMTTGIFEDISQTFSALKMDLSWLMKKISNLRENENQKFQSMFELIGNSQKQLRNISHEIRPSHLDNLGLIPAVDWYTNEFQKRTGIVCKTITEPDNIEINMDLTVILFRIIQEVLDNVEKYSEASEVEIKIVHGCKNLELVIIDNGIGISEEKINDLESLGLLSIKEMVLPHDGRVNISGSHGAGTSVNISIPNNKIEECLS